MQQIEITDENIKFAEQFLLPENCHFDDERIKFIKDLSTLDLQSVPGSGKTTALLAKLICLERNLPFEDNSGILVISHTNTAVDEIKEKIQIFAPKLFEYPNFVGTIQTFVDQFLLMPFYLNRYKHHPYRIDNEILKERCHSFYETALRYKKNWNIKYAPEMDLFKLELDKNSCLIETNATKRKGTQTYNLLEKFKNNEIEKGFLKYEDSFDLSNIFLSSFPIVKTFIQKRFKYIFVDEMQDMNLKQYNILEELFANCNECVFQRIGDINQAIYNNDKSEKPEWKSRDKTLTISGSNRLNPIVANIVEKFGIKNKKIIGYAKNSVKPRIIVYDEMSKEKVIPHFISIIEELTEKDVLPDKQKGKYVAIGWVKNYIKQFWNSFAIDNVKTKIDYENLYDYLTNFDTEKQTMGAIRKQILNALLKILRFEDVKDENDRYYSIRNLFDYLKNSTTEIDDFNYILYLCCKDVIRGSFDSAYSKLKDYIPGFLTLFKKGIYKSKNFIETLPESINNVKYITSNNNFPTDKINLSVQTVHSVKGQTYTGVLYLESKYEGKYEVEYLKECFYGNCLPKEESKKVYTVEAANIVYVGFSRPTHLLCYAIQKDRYNQYLKDKIDINNWGIEFV